MRDLYAARRRKKAIRMTISFLMRMAVLMACIFFVVAMPDLLALWLFG